ncbi:hypothetical protein [Nonomuraea salmonea]|uniref:hypothetical protein n=1 Tax=Nonomuraea salmonea TaxID=46181 RepID=UPI0031ED0399
MGDLAVRHARDGAHLAAGGRRGARRPDLRGTRRRSRPPPAPPLPGEEQESGYVQRDDDRHWHLAGMLYANRMDPAILVHQRVGGRWTLNLGNPIAWAITAVIAVVTLLSVLGVIDLPESTM